MHKQTKYYINIYIIGKTDKDKDKNQECLNLNSNKQTNTINILIHIELYKRIHDWTNVHRHKTKTVVI